MGIGELCNIQKYVISMYFIQLNRHTSFDYWWNVFPSVDPYALTERPIYGSRAYGFQKRTQPIATPQIDDFWWISYCFVQIVMLIRIQMHFVLLTTISLLFVWEGHFWII